MKISPIGQYYTANNKQLPYSKKQNNPIFQRNYNIDKFSKQLASGVAAATGIMAGVSIANASLKLDGKRLDEFLRENEWSPVRIPKIYYASPEQAKRIREILISNDKATEIPVLYLGLRDGRLFNDLEKHDLSAVPDILLGIEEEGNKIFKFGHYDDFLKVIYRFLYVYAEDLKNDEFTAKLQEVLDYVKEKRNLAYEDVSERIRESDGDTERILMTKQYQKNLADKNIKADIVKNTFENTQVLSSSDIFVADKNAQNYKMGPWIFEKFLDEQYHLDYRNNNPPIWGADKKEAQIIRKIFIDNGNPDGLLDLYSRENNKAESVLSHNLEEFNISALPDLAECLDNKSLDSERKYIYSNMILWDIYNFIFKHTYTLENDDFTKELEKYVNIMQGNIENYLKENPNEKCSIPKFLEDEIYKSRYKYQIYEQPQNKIKEIKSDFVKSVYGTPYKKLEKADYTNIDNVLKLLKSYEVSDSKGEILNFESNIINSIADIIPSDVDTNKYDEMINLLKTLPKIDYNCVDEYGISVMEKVMNAENAKLLDVIKDKGIKYLPELDYAYKNINDKDFLKTIDEMNFDVNELRDAIRDRNVKRLTDMEPQLKNSPIIFNNRSILNKIKDSLRYTFIWTASSAFERFFEETYPSLYKKCKNH